MSHSSESNNKVDDGDDQEGSSFSSEANIENALTSFREKWRRELEISQKRDPSIFSSKAFKIDMSSEDASIENKAKNLFLKGVEHEQSRRFYEAIQFYKRAVQLVPDIEFRLYESTNVKSREKFDADDDLKGLDNDINTGDDNSENDDDEDEEDCDLIVKLCKIVYRNRCVCFPTFEQSATHVSALPMEIVLYILRWVVSSELDLRSLEMFSSVCRGFYISARDTEIWRLACVRVWGVNCGTYNPKYESWRDMYLNRPRLRYNGCYISKTSYIRAGEESFQDRYYRPWHVVEYFRYLRFFPEGKVLMLTSIDEPQNCVHSLKSRTPRNQSILMGHYRIHDNYVTMVLKKQDVRGISSYKRKKRESGHDNGEQTFHIEFEIEDHHKRRNFQLNWLGYTIFTRYRNDQEVKICFKEPFIGGRYPSLKFSRVKSYTQESEAPLQ